LSQGVENDMYQSYCTTGVVGELLHKEEVPRVLLSSHRGALVPILNNALLLCLGKLGLDRFAGEVKHHPNDGLRDHFVSPVFKAQQVLEGVLLCVET
jgi:hypothetical protein